MLYLHGLGHFHPENVIDNAFLERLEKRNAPGVEGLRGEWLPKLTQRLDALQQAADEHEAARKAQLDAFGTELALRDDHRLDVQRLMGLVRAEFPGDRGKQDAIFPDIRVRRSSGGDGGDAEGDG